MQLHQLAYFLAVAETGSFTHAATREHVVQSAISTAIARLERELGSVLLVRGAKTVTLTDEGRTLLPRAREAVAAFAAARSAIDDARGLVTGTVALGTLAYHGFWDLPDLMATLHEAYPRVTIRLRQTMYGSTSSVEEVRSGSLDLALISTNREELPGIALDLIHRESLVFACPADHPLAGAAHASVADIAAERYVDFPAGWGNQVATERMFAAAGVARQVITEATEFGLALALIGRGLGVAILPGTAVPGGDVVAVPLEENPVWTVSLARPTTRPQSAATRAVAAHIRARHTPGPP